MTTEGVKQMTVETSDVIVVGGGQAGLATAFELRRLGVGCLVIEANARVGDQWRRRWDSLRLFTPAQHDGLPGSPFPAPEMHFPTKDEMADYLEAYAADAALPVLTGTKVVELRRSQDRYEVVTSAGACNAGHV